MSNIGVEWPPMLEDIPEADLHVFSGNFYARPPLFLTPVSYQEYYTLLVRVGIGSLVQSWGQDKGEA